MEVEEEEELEVGQKIHQKKWKLSYDIDGKRLEGQSYWKEVEIHEGINSGNASAKASSDSSTALSLRMDLPFVAIWDGVTSRVPDKSEDSEDESSSLESLESRRSFLLGLSLSASEYNKLIEDQRQAHIQRLSSEMGPSYNISWGFIAYDLSKSTSTTVVSSQRLLLCYYIDFT
ncbi:hypothetical protein Taro_028549 [Colocasia esculenta]|uniref:Uncharacterized protein n=1 Tax=Colocasia esculenta TaxID=4460 RepID=A0A843VGR4_COLES|nr:hypothetical protein [Colocasia esculenta]